MQTFIRYSAVAILSVIATFLVCRNFGICGADCPTIRKEAFKPVPMQQFLTDVARYKNMIADSITRDFEAMDLKIEASRQCTFTVNTIRYFFYLLDSAADANNLDKSSLAVTWNYAVYEKEHLIQGVDYGRLQTLYAIPSIIDKGGLANPISISSSGWESFKNPTFNQTADILLLHSSAYIDDPTTLIQNQGQLCPPTCTNPGLWNVIEGMDSPSFSN